MNQKESGRLGGQATYARYGSEHMAEIGRLGFQATIRSLATRNPVDPAVHHNTFRYLLRNLNNTKPPRKRIILRC